MPRRPPLFFTAVVLSAFAFAGCDDEASAEPVTAEDQAAVQALAPYARSWQAAEPLYRDEAFTPVAEAIRAKRPEYSVAEITDLFAATADVDYAALRIDGQVITFANGETVLCAARYRLRPGHGHDHDHASGQAGADAAAHEHTSQTFDLVATTAGECSSYASLEISVIEMHGPLPHFHLAHGTAVGPLRPAPWSPAVWATELTSQQFADLAMGATAFFASALPPK